jgi:FkbM family methyltransferase
MLESTLCVLLKVGPTGKVYAFEPMERNLRYLRCHIAVNHRLNGQIVVEAAVSDTDGTQRFSGASWQDSLGRLSFNGELEVGSVTWTIALMETAVYLLRPLSKSTSWVHKHSYSKAPSGSSLDTTCGYS